MSDRGYAGNCNSPRECLNRFSGFGRNDVGYYVCNPSASKIVEDVFGSTPYVVFGINDSREMSHFFRNIRR